MKAWSIGISIVTAVVIVTACSSDGPTNPLTHDLPSARADAMIEPLAGGWGDNGCRVGDFLEPVGAGNPYDANNDLAVCYNGTDYYDNRIPNEPEGGGWQFGCRAGDVMIFISPGTLSEIDKNGDGAICNTGSRYYDNKLDEPKGGDGGGWVGGCRAGDALIFISPGTLPEIDKNGDGAICNTGSRYYDNRL